jgi:hypothetical protein
MPNASLSGMFHPAWILSWQIYFRAVVMMTMPDTAAAPYEGE